MHTNQAVVPGEGRGVVSGIDDFSDIREDSDTIKPFQCVKKKNRQLGEC